MQAAADATRGQAPPARQHAACQAYRDWADQHRTEFLLLYGTPVPGYRPPADGPISAASRRLADPFLDVVFDGWTPEELAAVPLQPGAEQIVAMPPALSLPPGALALFIELRGRLHGLVMLELLGHAHPLNAHAGALFRGAVSRMSTELAALRGYLARVAGEPEASRGMDEFSASVTGAGAGSGGRTWTRDELHDRA